MRRIRIIPVITIDGQKMVKTIRFKNPNYLGDPINAIKIFNEKEVDEIIVLDITASQRDTAPNFKLVEEMASECFMPLGYGGGIRTIEHVKKLFSLGVEKVILNSVLLTNLALVNKIAKMYGTQSVVASLDVKKIFFGGVRPHFFKGRKSLNKDITAWAVELEKEGVGEIILNNIDRDGTFLGFDYQLIKKLTSAVSIPVVPCGGAGSVEDLLEAIRSGASAVAAGSLFAYKNNDVKSILINYPNQNQLAEKIYNNL